MKIRMKATVDITDFMDCKRTYQRLKKRLNPKEHENNIIIIIIIIINCIINEIIIIMIIIIVIIIKQPNVFQIAGDQHDHLFIRCHN